MESFSLKFFKSRNIKFFLIGFVFSLPFFWGANVFQKNLEDFLFWEKISDNPQLLAAQIIQENKLEQLKPIRNWQIPNLEISAKSVVSVFLNSQGGQKILFSKESEKVLPIASLTKLMTANVILENYDLSQTIKISKRAVAEEGETGYFKVGEIFFTEGLLYSSLVESSNDATAALVQAIGENAFVDLMNLEAKNLGLKNTYFVNATGLDHNSSDVNQSTAEDLVIFAAYLLKTNLKILKISALPEYDLYLADRTFHHNVRNTDELLEDTDGIIGSKTGETPKAGSCLILVKKVPQDDGYLVNIILGSPDRFEEMKKLLNWLQSAYKW